MSVIKNNSTKYQNKQQNVKKSLWQILNVLHKNFNVKHDGNKNPTYEEHKKLSQPVAAFKEVENLHSYDKMTVTNKLQNTKTKTSRP